MSILSRARNIKHPTINARRELKQALAATPAFAHDHLGRPFAVTLPFNAEPGHRDLGLIRKKNSHGQYLGLGGTLREKRGGAFGGVSKAERRRRAILREVAENHGKAA